jgi:GH24 family phage-related lysozyme (muramidase)
MKRLWPLGSDIHKDMMKRREDEATLFEKGLST